jgi:PAS domain S-box-containing protein
MTERTSQEIRTEVEAQIGFFPPFFSVFWEQPAILENLWQQTHSAYLKNPLPAIFKEKLFAYLTHYYVIPTCFIGHCHQLQSLGVTIQQILHLITVPMDFSESTRQIHLAKLTAQTIPLDLSNLNPELEQSLLSLILFLHFNPFLQPEVSNPYRQAIRDALGSENYANLTLLLAFLGTCHQLKQSYPEQFCEIDQRIQPYLTRLLQKAPSLGNFFHNYSTYHTLEELPCEELSEKSVEIPCPKHIDGTHPLEPLLYQIDHQLRRVLGNMPVMLDAFDAEGNIVVWNQECERVTGYRAEEIVGNPKAMRMLYPDPHYLASMMQRWQECGDDYRAWEWQLTAKDGVVKTIAWSNISKQFPIPGWATWGIGVDVTEHKQAEAALKASEQHYLSLAKAAPVGIFHTDAQGNCRYVNQRWCQISGLIPTEALGVGWSQTLHPEDQEKIVTEWNAAVEEERPFQLEYRFRRPDGQETWVFGQAVAERDPDGRITGYVGTITDISDRKQAEQEIYQLNQALADQNQNLEALVEQRTEALTQYAQQLEVLNHELESFSYSVSHDLRAPLRHVHGFVIALARQLAHLGVQTDPKVAHYLEVIEDSSKKMGLLIDGLLTLSRCGRRPMKVEPVNLNTLVAQAIRLVKMNLDKHSSVEFMIQDLPRVPGDATLLQQVFSNLVDNAVKFSRDRTPARIEIGVLPDGTLFVKDNGVGFQMDYANQLFGAFQRLHPQSEFEGTGVGLAIVQRIIHRHGGSIWAEAQPDQGACFYLRLG